VSKQCTGICNQLGRCCDSLLGQYRIESYRILYSNISIQIECFSRTRGHISTHIQGNIIHARNLNYSLHVCVCVCVHRCAELWNCLSHVEPIGIWHTHIFGYILNNLWVHWTVGCWVKYYCSCLCSTNGRSGKVIAVVSSWR
jgi:hypothetical protein